MTGNKLLDCCEMFRHACAFADCADFCREQEEHILYSQPEAVNSAFACEVFLKALCFYHDIDWKDIFKQSKPKKKGHDLKSLYDILPERVKDHVYYSTLNIYGCWKNAFGIDYLTLVSNTFEKNRYLYEHDLHKQGSVTTYVGFLRAFRNILRDVCCQLLYSTTWDEYKRG